MATTSRDKTDTYIQSLPQHIEDMLRGEEKGHIFKQFRALPPAILERCTKLCGEVDAAPESRKKHLMIAEIADIIGEYFDGYGNIFECLTGWNFFNFKNQIVKQSKQEISVQMLTEQEEAAVKELPTLIDNSKSEVRERYIVAWIRLAQKSHADMHTVTINKIGWCCNGASWKQLREKWISMTTQELIPNFFQAPVPEPEHQTVSVAMNQVVGDVHEVLSLDSLQGSGNTPNLRSLDIGSESFLHPPTAIDSPRSEQAILALAGAFLNGNHHSYGDTSDQSKGMESPAITHKPPVMLDDEHDGNEDQSP